MLWFQRWLSKRKPWVFENSKIPVWLSKLAPIEINALSIACFVFCRGEISKTTRRHETIHYHQQWELLFVGQWILYAVFYLSGLIRYRSGEKAYRENPFEREAYDNQKKYTYLEKRPLWNWTHYIKD
jgi:hypothetical protein